MTGWIGRPLPRPNARRLLAGRGRFVDDLVLPRMLHAAFVRSPHAHARILSVDLAAARAAPGVVAAWDGADIAPAVEPFVAVLTHLKGMQSAPQPPLALGTTHWQGEPVAIILATSRAEAEDAAQLVEVDYDPLPPVVDAETALDPQTPVIHPALGSNLCLERRIEAGPVDEGLARAAHVIERTFHFGRHTGVTLEPRACLYDWEASEGALTLHYSGQVPHMMQEVLARHLGLEQHRVRVVARDVGGSFGIKIHVYGDEIACAVAAMRLGRPVKFVADRLESFLSDIHARDHRVTARLAADAAGRFLALEIDDLTGIGPYSVYPRSSGIEGNQVINLTGAPYDLPAYRARLRVVFQTKAPMCQYRAVGHPIAVAVMEGLIDDLAARIGADPLALRALNARADDSYPARSPQGMLFADLSHQACLERLKALMDYDARRAEQARLRTRGIHRGIGLCLMVEITNPSPMFYGVGGAPISAADGVTLRLDPSGAVHLAASVTEQGQGTETVLAQVVAGPLGLSPDQVVVTTGDTRDAPYGGGTWASRGAGIGGEAARAAAQDLAAEILRIAGVILQADPAGLHLAGGAVQDATGPRMTLRDLARLCFWRGNDLPADLMPQLAVARHFRITDMPFVYSNGAMAAEVEVDQDTGLVRLVDFWVVEDVGTILNPLLVDEQIRGGVVQGIGAALFEECLYDGEGQMLNGSMADYLVPMAAEMPDITIAHVVTPSRASALGAKGAGEAGTAGAPAVVLNAVNDALAPLGARLDRMPMTPERVLRALGRVD